MREEDFQSKSHVTKHLTLGRFGRIDEATRINSWPELDWLNWNAFLAETLRPEMVTPSSLKTISDASTKYAKAYGSFGFGAKRALKGRSLYILIILGVVGLVFILYMMGIIGG